MIQICQTPFCGRGSPREAPHGRLDPLPAGIDWRERSPQGGRAAAHLLVHQLSLPEAAAGGPEGGAPSMMVRPARHLPDG